MNQDQQTGLPDAAWLSEQDQAILAQVELSLANARTIKAWWEQAGAANAFAERFDLMQTFNRRDQSFNFFDSTTLNGEPMPIMGVVQDIFYDHQKSPNPERWREQLREFVLRYFMRISDFRRPEEIKTDGQSFLASYLRSFDWYRQSQIERDGFGYSQRYYQLRDSGVQGKFPEDYTSAIVDMREVGTKYEWVVCNVRIFDFKIEVKPLGVEFPHAVFPLKEESLLILSPDFIVNTETSDEEGVIGQYGFGYALLKEPPDDSLLAYGPGKFDAGFQLIHFRLFETGEVRVKLVFVVNRPKQIMKLSAAQPIAWSVALVDRLSFGMMSPVVEPVKRMLNSTPLGQSAFDPFSTLLSLLNLSSGGLAAKEFGLSREEMEKNMMIRHYIQHYEMIIASLLTWRQIPDWCASDEIPEWVKTGTSS